MRAGLKALEQYSEGTTKVVIVFLYALAATSSCILK